MAYEQEDAIVVTPPTEIETESESETTPVAGNRGTSAAIVQNEPKPSREFTYTREDIKAFARDEVQKLVDEGEFEDIVEANPETTGSEPELESLKVGGVKYQIPSGTPVAANPTLAGTESALTGLKVGDTKYKVEQPTEVVANPTLEGTESDLSGLQVGNTKYKVGGGSGGGVHCYNITFKVSGRQTAKNFLYYTDNAEITNKQTFLADLTRRGFTSGTKSYPICARDTDQTGSANATLWLSITDNGGSGTPYLKGIRWTIDPSTQAVSLTTDVTSFGANVDFNLSNNFEKLF